MKLEISRQIFRNPQISNLMKISYAGAEMFHADGQTDRQKDGRTDDRQIIYYRYSALGPVWAETRAQSVDWYSSGTLHPGQVLRGSLPLLSPGQTDMTKIIVAFCSFAKAPNNRFSFAALLVVRCENQAVPLH